jgi:tetratricopeptide (TPR) repeat protein
VNVDIATITARLNVSHILEGSVRKSGNRIRITAQLVNASTSEHLWSETYDRDFGDIFSLQDEVSAAVVGAIEEHLGLLVEAAPLVITTANTEAHDAYLRGRYLVVRPTRESVDGAIREFEKAIALDPDYARAHAELAMATIVLGVFSDITTTERIKRAAPHAERAMALEPTLAEAHAATGFVLWEQGNLEEAMAHFEHAIQINPNYSIVYLWMANLLDNRLGRYKEAVVMWEKAARLDPLSITIIAVYTHLLINSNRLAEADRELEKLESIAPPGWYTSMRGTRMSVGGKWSNTVMANLDVLRIVPDRDSVPARNILTEFFAAIGLDKEALAISAAPRPGVLRILGRPEDAVTTAETRLAEDPNSPWDRRDLGLALAAAGDYARARPILEEMWQRSRGRITVYGIFSTESAAALIAIRRNAGEETGSGGLVAALKDNAHRYREAGMIRARLFYAADYDDGLASFLAGNRKRGLALIAKAAKDGFFIRPGEAYLQSLYDDPDFAPIRASQEARQARERERFLARVCTVNPYEAVWQPAEGTCERFAVAGGN